MPTFCRHNRFLERCPICSKTLPGNSPAASSGVSRRPAGGPRAESAARRQGGGQRLSIRRQERAAEDGYASALLPGLHASADAARLAEEISFSASRLLALGACPPGLYAELRALAPEDLEQATWACFLIAYLCPLEGPEPFAGIRTALAADRHALAELDELALGPRASHDPRRGAETLSAYRKWIEQACSQELAFTGDPGWSPERRFERLFERLALPGFRRCGRYELLVLLGALGLYELRAGSLLFAGGRGAEPEDPATLAAKRVFAIGDPLLLDRRSAALSAAISVPVESLELALANWGSAQRATLGFPGQTCDEAALARTRDALGL